MKVFSVFGYTDSGKTTTVENIIRELKRRGFTVGSVKDIHYEQFTMDSEGTDTMRHKEAGAELVTARGFFETNFLFPGKLSISEILRFYTQDYVVLEGVRDVDVPKILCAKSVQEIDHRFDDSVFLISGVISNGMTEHKGMPVISAVADIAAVVDLIEMNVKDYIAEASK